MVPDLKHSNFFVPRDRRISFIRKIRVITVKGTCNEKLRIVWTRFCVSEIVFSKAIRLKEIPSSCVLDNVNYEILYRVLC